MLNKKIFFSFLLPLFVFLYTNGFGNAIDTKHATKDIIQGEVSNSNSEKNAGDGIYTLEGILQTSVRLTENTCPTFLHFNNYKKHYSYTLTWQSAIYSQTLFNYYCFKRQESNTPPRLYIVYRSITI